MSDFKRLLYVCNYPPSDLAGAPIIVRQLLKTYDQDRLFILCDRREYQPAERSGTLLPCQHDPILSMLPWDLRPRRFAGPIRDALNILRIPQIVKRGLECIAEHQIEALFVPLHAADFGVAAWYMHRESGLPLYVFETDDWEAMYPKSPVSNQLTKHFHSRILSDAKCLWVTSPQMRRIYSERHQVESHFLFHFLDWEPAVADKHPLAESRGAIRIVYTGSINTMFASTLKWVTTRINAGIEVDGRPVILHIHTGSDCGAYIGPRVFDGGRVPYSDIPDILACADLLLVAVSFSQENSIRRLVATSLYTKTIDYLASGRPVLVVSPANTAQVDYFGSVTHVLSKLDEAQFVAAIEKLIKDEYYAGVLAERGRVLIEQNHSLSALRRIFLDEFRANDVGQAVGATNV